MCEHGVRVHVREHLGLLEERDRGRKYFTETVHTIDLIVLA